MTLKEQVLHVLKNYPKSRDSDQWLTIKIWAIFYPEYINRTDPINPKINLIDIMELPREDTVKRTRAYIQNEEGLFPPTTLEVALRRQWKEAMLNDGEIGK